MKLYDEEVREDTPWPDDLKKFDNHQLHVRVFELYTSDEWDSHTVYLRVAEETHFVGEPPRNPRTYLTRTALLTGDRSSHIRWAVQKIDEFTTYYQAVCEREQELAQ